MPAICGRYLYHKKEKERRDMESLTVPRGIEEKKRIFHSCQSS